MMVPLQLTMRGTTQTPGIADHVRRRVAQLDRFGGIVGCHVTVEGPHRHHRKGNLWSVRVDLTVHGAELAVSRGPGEDHTHEDLHVAIGDAFDAALRRLNHRIERRRALQRH
jgi:ribosome-associated translation inhibitor RaiA